MTEATQYNDEIVDDGDEEGSGEPNDVVDDPQGVNEDNGSEGGSEDDSSEPNTEMTEEQYAEAIAALESEADELEADDDSGGLPDDWREVAAAGDESTLKLLQRYGSLSGVAKALSEAQKALRSGKTRQEMPDPSDEKAMAAWRKAEGIPDDPTGYVLPEEITKRLIDDDKPILSSFTEFAHSKNLPPDAVAVASEWYVTMQEAAAEHMDESDRHAFETAEDALRKDWSHSEYKSNMTLGARFGDTIPGVGKNLFELRSEDGRKLGSIPEFISWAAEMGRNQYGDVSFSSSDAESKLNDRKAEIDKIRQTDFEAYEADRGMVKEYQDILAKEMKRGNR